MQGEFTLGKNRGIFNLPCLIKFVNIEFIFAIGGPKLDSGGEEHRTNTAQNSFLFFLAITHRTQNMEHLVKGVQCPAMHAE